MVDATLHSKADQGNDEESTQAYVLVRRGVCRGDNKDMHMKVTWYKTSEKREEKLYVQR